MLIRINEIRNIGRFHDCKLGGCQFSAKTIIFGNNGNGKSTLTCIFRSLATGVSDYLIGRKTLGSVGSKYVELSFAKAGTEKQIYFKNKLWSESKNDILIFDSKFISENVFDGENISEFQKTNLHRVIIGDKGRLLIDQIRLTNEEVKKLEGEKKEKTNLYQGSEMKNYFTLDKYAELQQDSDIDKKIQENSNEYEYAKQLNKPKELSFKEKKFSNFEVIMKKSVASSHDDAEGKIKKQIAVSWKECEHSYEFLKSGTQLLKNEGPINCPFCGQSLQSVAPLIDAYKTYFDKSYDELVTEINTAIKAFNAWNFENDLTTLLSEAKDWVRFFDDAKPYSDLEGILIEVKRRLSELKPVFDAECEKKAKNLNYQPDLISLAEMKNEWGKVKNAATSFNKLIAAYAIKSTTTDLDKLRAELGRLRSHRKRFSPEWMQISDRYLLIKKTLLKIKQDRDTLVHQLSAHSKDIFEKHQETINAVLEDIGADFKIKKFAEQKDLRKAEAVFCGFELEFYNKHKVPLEAVETQPNFKNTLSQGDKSALAFAFFLSLLNEDENLDNKIIVFDDPVSSFDDERRRKTVKYLSNLSNKKKVSPKQIIILTHEKNFLTRLFEENFFGDATYLKIIGDGHEQGQKKSTLKHCNVEEEFVKKEVVKHIEEFKRLLEGNMPAPADADEKGRLILENAFQNKYYLELKDVIKARKSLRAYVEALNAQGVKGFEESEKKWWNSFFDDLHLPHHTAGTKNQSDKSEGDIKSILKDTLLALKKV